MEQVLSILTSCNINFWGQISCLKVLTLHVPQTELFYMSIYYALIQDSTCKHLNYRLQFRVAQGTSIMQTKCRLSFHLLHCLTVTCFFLNTRSVSFENKNCHLLNNTQIWWWMWQYTDHHISKTLTWEVGTFVQK